MAFKSLVLILASVLLSAVAQILLKVGMGAAATRQAMSDASMIGSYTTILSQPAVLAGLACYVLGALVWLRVLSGVDVSKAYPFVALGIVATMLLGSLLLHEQVTTMRALGAAIIMVGVVLVGLS